MLLPVVNQPPIVWDAQTERQARPHPPLSKPLVACNLAPPVLQSRHLHAKPPQHHVGAPCKSAQNPHRTCTSCVAGTRHTSSPGWIHDADPPTARAVLPGAQWTGSPTPCCHLCAEGAHPSGLAASAVPVRPWCGGLGTNNTSWQRPARRDPTPAQPPVAPGQRGPVHSMLLRRPALCRAGISPEHDHQVPSVPKPRNPAGAGDSGRGVGVRGRPIPGPHLQPPGLGIASAGAAHCWLGVGQRAGRGGGARGFQVL